MRIERTLPISLSEVEALERAYAFLPKRGYKLAGSVEEIRFRRGRFLSSFWALSPSMWSVEVVVEPRKDSVHLCFDVTPTSEQVSSNEKSYWDSEVDALAAALSGAEPPAPRHTLANRQSLIVNTTGLALIVALVWTVTYFGGPIAGLLALIIAIAGAFAYSRLTLQQ